MNKGFKVQEELAHWKRKSQNSEIKVTILRKGNSEFLGRKKSKKKKEFWEKKSEFWEKWEFSDSLPWKKLPAGRNFYAPCILSKEDRTRPRWSIILHLQLRRSWNIGVKMFAGRDEQPAPQIPAETRSGRLRSGVKVRPSILSDLWVAAAPGSRSNWSTCQNQWGRPC